MTTRLHIDISQGVLEVEGDPVFVRAIYDDFKEQLVTGPTTLGEKREAPQQPSEADVRDAKPRTKVKRKGPARKRANGEENGSGISADAPKLNRDLDTAGLSAFYGEYAPKNHPEKILVFLSYLTEELAIEAPDTDQVYTCYVKAGQRVPKAFAQAFRDTSGRSFGYIEYKSPADIRITTVGANHFKFDLKKQGGK